MFRYTTIIILLLTLFSCEQPVGKEVVEIDTQKMDDILLMSDSLLSIADIEMDNIKEHSMDVNKRIEYLIDKNKRYERKLEENSLKLVEFILEIDSLNNTVKNKDLIIQLNMKTINQNQSDFEVMSEFCETEINKLTSTVEMLNDSIDNIMDEINEHFKEHRVEKIFDSH